MRAFLLPLLLCLPILPAPAYVTRVEIQERSAVLDGRAFATGAYERVTGRAWFALDPAKPQNRAIHGLSLAPRNQQGLVEFSADFYLLQPADPKRSNGTLLLEIPNRGGKEMLARFMYAKPSPDPRSTEDFGDLWLLDQGFTLLWVGWQWDVPPAGAKLLRLFPPVIPNTAGPVRSEFIPAARTTLMPLADRAHAAYPALPAPATLSARDSVLARRRRIAPSQWKFTADRTAVELPSGFEPGRIYELVYQAAEPRLQGAGLASVRDFTAYLKHPPAAGAFPAPSPAVRHTIAFGISQSGRFLRTLLYLGMNEDEMGRIVFDGVWADVAGAGRGSFNHLFAQPSRDGYAHFNTLYPTDIFPFSDTPQPAPGSDENDGLLLRLRPAMVPKIFYTNGSWEYWNRCAALIHTSSAGDIDVPLHPNSRYYFVAGSQHGPGHLPSTSPSALYPLNPNDTRPLQRALLAALHEWVRDGRLPPPSKFPTLADEELVPRARIRWPKTTGAALPEFPKQAYLLDYGEDFPARGIVSIEPPRVLARFPVLLPQVDADGIDLGGIRLPAVAVPLGTFTGWNLRHPSTGAPRQMAPLSGSFFAFPPAGIERRYTNKERYLGLIGASAEDLIRRRFLLPADRGRIRAHAAGLWDFVARNGKR